MIIFTKVLLLNNIYKNYGCGMLVKKRVGFLATIFLLVFLFTSLSFSGILFADPVVTTTFSGVLTLDQTFYRPLSPSEQVVSSGDPGDVFPGEDFKAQGEDLFGYFIKVITPSVTGSFSIKVTDADLSGGGSDTYLLLYEGSFNPEDPLANLIWGNDDISPGGADPPRNVFSWITSKTLTAGTQYIIVTSSWASGDYGTVDFEVTGPATVTVTDKVQGSSAAGTPRPLTPDEWVALNLNMGQLVDHYGATSLGFLGMLYDNIMQRIPDAPGLNYWNEQLTGGVFGANQVVEHFIFSDEIGGKVAAMSNEEFINFLYNTLFARVSILGL
jgi:hypothetical protein